MVRVDNSATVKNGKANGKPSKAKRAKPIGRAAGEAPKLAPAAQQSAGEAPNKERWEATNEWIESQKVAPHPLAGLRALDAHESCTECVFVSEAEGTGVVACRDEDFGEVFGTLADDVWIHYPSLMTLLAKRGMPAPAMENHAPTLEHVAKALATALRDWNALDLDPVEDVCTVRAHDEIAGDLLKLSTEIADIAHRASIFAPQAEANGAGVQR